MRNRHQVSRRYDIYPMRALTHVHRKVEPSAVIDQAALRRSSFVRLLEAGLVRLGPNEFHRRLWHFAPGLLALVGATIPYYEPVSPYLLVLIAILCVVVSLYAMHWQQAIRRPNERNCLAAIWGYGLSVAPLFLLFPSQPEFPLTVAGIIAFGDGSATLVGLLAQGEKLPWNLKKSWAGSGAFIAAGLPLATWIYWNASVPHVSLSVAVPCVAPAVVASAIVESLPWRVNDNFFVGASAAVVLIAMHVAVVGWL